MTTGRKKAYKYITPELPWQKNKLIVIGELPPNGKHGRLYQCVCLCGKPTITRVERVFTNGTKSCGCLSRIVALEVHTKHGECGSGSKAWMKATPEYKAWKAMLRRAGPTSSANVEIREYYANRGITVCKRWLTYRLFLLDMGRKPTSKHTLDRIDNNKGYFPGNCRWATMAEQCRNTSRNINITFSGQTKCLKDWATELGIECATLKYRLRHYPIDVAFLTPIRALPTDGKVYSGT